MRGPAPRLLWPGVWCLAAVCAAGCQLGKTPPLTATASDEWSRSYEVASGGEFQIVGASGSVDIQGDDVPGIEVKAERVAHAVNDATAREVLPRIAIREDVSPDKSKIVLQTQGLGGIVIGVSVAVNYHVRLPAAIPIRIRTADGAITIANMRSRIVASSANGEISGRSLSGGIDFRTVNGAVVLDLASFGQDPVDLRAVNGRVDVTLPADAAGVLTANCTNGTIDVTGLTFEPFGDQTARRVRGRINAGGTPIEITSVNGNIRVHPRP